MSARIIPFNCSVQVDANSKPQAVTADQKVGTPAQPISNDRDEIASAIDRRGEWLDQMYHFIRFSALGMVSDWREVFDLGCKHARYQNEQWTYGRKSSEMGEGIAQEHLKMCEETLNEDLNFYNRCAQIYAEEMKSVEARATRARGRVARRIQAEFGNMASGIPEALIENDPQKWANGIDWN